MDNIGRQLFSKRLTRSDLERRLPWPREYEHLLPFNDNSHQVDFCVKDGSGCRWMFRCSRRSMSNSYSKPVICAGWMDFARSQAELRAGDKVIFYQNEDPADALFVVSVRRVIQHEAPNMSSGEQLGPLYSPEANWFESMMQPDHPGSVNDAEINLPTGPLHSPEANWFESMMQSYMLGQPDNPGLVNDAEINLPTGPLYSNEAMWVASTMQSYYLLGQPQLYSVYDAGQGSHGQCSLQTRVLNEPVQLDESVRIDLNMTLGCGHLIISEGAVQGETRKRKTISTVEHAGSGNGKELACDDRQVKRTLEPSQPDFISDSSETHDYISASEGEPSTGECNQDLTAMEEDISTVNASDRPIFYRALDRFFGFLHQLKNYVA